MLTRPFYYYFEHLCDVYWLIPRHIFTLLLYYIIYYIWLHYFNFPDIYNFLPSFKIFLVNSGSTICHNSDSCKIWSSGIRCIPRARVLYSGSPNHVILFKFTNYNSSENNGANKIFHGFWNLMIIWPFCHYFNRSFWRIWLGIIKNVKNWIIKLLCIICMLCITTFPFTSPSCAYPVWGVMNQGSVETRGLWVEGQHQLIFAEQCLRVCLWVCFPLWQWNDSSST